MPNVTDFSIFLLLNFSDQVEKNVLYFILFLAIYIASLIANVLIILVVFCHHPLHTPMYFFLVNLSITDLGSISVTIPKAMINAFLNSREISHSGCVTQLFSLLVFGMSDFFLLTGMAYDRYVAICDPLHYETIMDMKACLKLAAIAWISALLYSTLHTCGTFAINFCSNVLNDFFCDVSQLLKLSCDDSYLIEVRLILFSITIIFPCFVFIIVSYVQIFKSMFRLSNLQRQNKVFSTCIPHLTVVSLFISTASVNLLKSPSVSPSNVEIVFLHCILLYGSSLMNPIVYTMRNREIQGALYNMFKSGIMSRNHS